MQITNPTVSGENILSTSASVYDAQGYLRLSAVTVAELELDGNQYIRIGQSLEWRPDVVETPGRLELSNGSVVVL